MHKAYKDIKHHEWESTETSYWNLRLWSYSGLYSTLWNLNSNQVDIDENLTEVPIRTLRLTKCFTLALPVWHWEIYSCKHVHTPTPALHPKKCLHISGIMYQNVHSSTAHHGKKNNPTADQMRVGTLGVLTRCYAAGQREWAHPLGASTGHVSKVISNDSRKS